MTGAAVAERSVYKHRALSGESLHHRRGRGRGERAGRGAVAVEVRERVRGSPGWPTQNVPSRDKATDSGLAGVSRSGVSDRVGCGEEADDWVLRERRRGEHACAVEGEVAGARRGLLDRLVQRPPLLWTLYRPVLRPTNTSPFRQSYAEATTGTASATTTPTIAAAASLEAFGESGEVRCRSTASASLLLGKWT